MDKTNLTFTTQFSFTTLGEENLPAIQELREKLVELKGRPLRDVYAAFGVAQLTEDTVEDILTKVEIVRTSRGAKPMYYFVFATETKEHTHSILWTSICRQFWPSVRLDALGSTDAGDRYCGELLTPPQLKSLSMKDEMRL